jgi:ribosome-associated protein
MTPNPQRPPSRELALAIARLLDDRKAGDILVLNLSELCSFTDYFVIATVESGGQLRGMTSAVSDALGEADISFQSEPVQAETTWAVIDAGDVIVHLFLPESREYYDLERLWGDAEQAPLTEEAAFSLPGL